MKTTPAGIMTSLILLAEAAASGEEAIASGTETGPDVDDFSKFKTLTMKDGKVLMEAVFADITADQLAQMLDDAGVSWRDDKGDPALSIITFTTAAGTLRTFLSGYIDPKAVLDLPNVVSGDGSFISATPIGYQVSSGLTTSQGDVAQKSDDARAQFEVDGTGVTVGVLSDSYGAEASASGTPTSTTVAGDIASGDLPAGGVQVLLDGAPFSTDGDEGRAMLQIIHDVAPGADLAFHTAGGGQAVFASGILALRNTAGADVIVDDIIYFAEPIFQDGIIAQAVGQVVADGAVYLSSAGNNGDDGFLDTYRNSGLDGDTIAVLATVGSNLGALHDWNDDPNVVATYVELTLSDGDDFSISFQFNEPYASAGGVGSTADYDIFITYIDSQGNEVIESSGIGFANNINSDPIEIVEALNDSGADRTYRIYITQFDAPDSVATNLIAGVFFSTAGGSLREDFDPEIEGANGTMIDAPQFDGPTVFGHTQGPGGLGIGASAWFNTPERTEFGFNPLSNALLNGFSSHGGFDIHFSANGTRLVTPETRDAVDFVAPDGGNTTFFGSDTSADPDVLPNFFGTSAAAPHAAGLVALMLELNPSLSPSEIESILEASTTPILRDSSGRFTGEDATGAGFIDSVTALANVPAQSFDGTENDDTITGDANANAINGFGGNDVLDGALGNDTIVGGQGNDSIIGGEGDDLLIGDDQVAAEAAATAVVGVIAGPNTGGGGTNGTDDLPEDRVVTHNLEGADTYAEDEAAPDWAYDPLNALFSGYNSTFVQYFDDVI